MSTTKNRATFKTMREGTREDFLAVENGDSKYAEQLPGALLAELKRLDDAEPAMNISRYQHSLQSATRAYRDGADEELVVAALLHDIGDNLAVYNHADLSAAILKPYVSEKTHWIIKHHAIFQGYYYWHHLGDDRHARENYRGHPWFDACAEFCEKYDQNSFDENYDTLPIEFFTPMLQRIFARPPFGEHLQVA